MYTAPSLHRKEARILKKITITLLLFISFFCFSFITASAGTYTVSSYYSGSFGTPNVTVTNSAGARHTGGAFWLLSPVTNVTQITQTVRLDSVTSGSSLYFNVFYSTDGVNFTIGTTVYCPRNSEVSYTINFGTPKTIKAFFYLPNTATWPGYSYTVWTPLITRILTDNTAPTISLSEQSYYSRTGVTVTANITDSESGVSVRKWAQGYQTTSYFNSYGTSFSGSFSVTANGYYTVYARDAAGNASVSYIYVTRMDTTLPVINASVPSVYSTTNTVTANITDSQSGITVKKWAYGYNTATYVSSYGNTINGNTFVTYQNGYVSIYARDNAGNESVYYVYISYVDNMPPTIYAYTSTEYAPTNTVTVNVTDSQSGVSVKKWTYGYYTESYFSYYGETLSGSTFTAYENGTYTIYTKDSVGNEAVVYVTVYYVDNTISVTHPISVNYSINPNSGNPYSADNAVITNNSRIKVRVSVQSFSAVSGGNIYFTDVTPTYFSSWNSLTASQTKRYIALGLQVAETVPNSTGWYSINRNTPVYGAEITNPILLGTLNPSGAKGNLSFLAKYGLAWDGSYTAKHSLTLLFQTE